MANVRLNRINANMQTVLAETIKKELTDPRLDNSIVSVLKVAVAQDLSHAKVNVSIFATNKEDAFLALKNSVPYLRKSLAKKMQLRIVPELHFVLDDSLEYASKMDQLFDKIKND